MSGNRIVFLNQSHSKKFVSVIKHRTPLLTLSEHLLRSRPCALAWCALLRESFAWLKQRVVFILVYSSEHREVERVGKSPQLQVLEQRLKLC